MASSAWKLKNGGCRIPAGKVMSLLMLEYEALTVVGEYGHRVLSRGFPRSWKLRSVWNLIDLITFPAYDLLSILSPLKPRRLSGYPIFRLNVASFACACFFVSALIHSRWSIRSFIATIRLSISSFMRAFASGLNARRAYSIPRASPRFASVCWTHRFQRGCCSFCPARYRLKKLKFSSTKAEDNIGAAAFTAIQRRYVFQFSTGRSFSIELTSAKNFGGAIFISVTGGTERAFRYSAHEKFGVSSETA